MTDQKKIPLGMAVPFIMGRRSHYELVSPVMQVTLRIMMHRARHWEAMETWGVSSGREPNPTPYPRSVMALVAEINKIRVEAQREEAARQRELHQKAAMDAAKREEAKPRVSRRVLNERRERSRSEINRRRAANNQDGSAAKGDEPVAGLTGRVIE